jgi:hypothetical protein
MERSETSSFNPCNQAFLHGKHQKLKRMDGCSSFKLRFGIGDSGFLDVKASVSDPKSRLLYFEKDDPASGIAGRKN